MPDIIRLLPDSVANQIAAGEVVQRPASAVKELLENAVDAKADKIEVFIKDAGRTLIQVCDNGIGMSETDARMSFERHATSKISSAEELFAIRTKGFRGEALASIAAIAQVELKTKKKDDETGTVIEIEGSRVKTQEPCACGNGTVFSIKNLFYNVPARRNFLKSDSVEFRHILDEFERVALAHPEISFSLTHNGSSVFHLESGNLRQRIVSLYGNPYNQRLVPVEEETFIVKIHGFIGKPEFAKRTRGEQFFFLNNRFIKNSYLHHAVQKAFDNLIPNDAFPSYFLFLDVDPKTIDINIHPTKTEVKFEDERSLYAILRSSIKKSLGQYNISPVLDFDQEQSFNIPLNHSGEIKVPTIKVDPTFNPFETKKDRPSNFNSHSEKRAPGNSNWEQLYKDHSETAMSGHQTIIESQIDNDIPSTESASYQLHGKYIMTHIRSGFLVIDQQRAHERILYEKFARSLEQNKGTTQRLLFPETMEFTEQEMDIISEIKENLLAIGYEIEEFGKNTVAVSGIPAEITESNTKSDLESLLEEYKINSTLKLGKVESLSRAMARNNAIKPGKQLSREEMAMIIDELFACAQPYHTAEGKPTIVTFTLDDLDRRFRKS